MSSDMRKALHRLKRRIGKERAQYERLFDKATSNLSRERAFGEANICGLIMGFIDEELRKLD